jgi:lipopolysaccharide/colanic/teichoic acid biosynthesis glycosyltransferase
VKSSATKRVFDILLSLTGIGLLLPFSILIAFFIIVDSRGGVFFVQTRVGQDNRDFRLFKFRTMKVNSDKGLNLTVGNKDSRITRAGRILRKFKLDELPQLINVLIGDMSIVGPRPEVRKYVDMYNAEQMQILKMKPGLTDYASIKYRNENEVLEKAEDPEEFYIREVMPEKLKLNALYMKKQSIILDIRLIFQTAYAVIFE